MKLKLSEITVGSRHRQDMGDIASLAASMSVALLHPIVVNSSYELIAGERRLTAARQLGWFEIPVTVVATLDDAATALKAERDENECRKDFAPSEAVALAAKLRQMEQPKAAERMAVAGRIGAEGKGSVKFTDPSAGNVRDKVAEAVRMSGPTLTKAEAVTAAAEAHPETYGPIRDEMDRTGKVSPAYHKLAEAAAAPEAPPVRLPHKPSQPRLIEADESEIIPRSGRPAGSLWATHLANCWQRLGSIEDLGGMAALAASWSPEERNENLRQLKSLRDKADDYISQLEGLCRKASRRTA